jgi:UDP-N-acetyl-3-dehydro-alpha-D-glucosamine 3-aminotranferase
MTDLPESVRLLKVPVHTDARGTLVAFDRNNLPFEPLRTFVITNVPESATRGGHRLSCDEFIWAQTGRCRLIICDGKRKVSMLLDDAQQGVLVPKGFALELTEFAPGTILMCLASRPYTHFNKRPPELFPSLQSQHARIPSADPSRRFARQEAEIRCAINRVFERGQFILGAEVAAFEAEFARYIGVRHTVGVGSGTQAITLALAALGVGAGDEVITVSLTFAATALAIEALGAKAVFVDVDAASRCMDAAAAEAAISPATAAILPVHLHGFPAPMHDIMRIAQRHGIAVVEDCAQAHGASVDGKHVGSFGHAAAFSFYPTKTLGAAGDAGAVVTNDTAVADLVRRHRNYGLNGTRMCVDQGVNSRLDEIQAAILRVLLPCLDGENNQRRDLAAEYRSRLNGSEIELPPHSDGAVYHQFAVAVNERDAVRHRLFEVHGIETALHYGSGLHQQPHFARSNISLPVTERLVARLLSLPIQSEVAAGHIDGIAMALRESVSTCRS